MPQKTLKPPIVVQQTAVDGFVNQIRELPQRSAGLQSGRLLFAIDATASREATWDLATSVQGEMFLSAADWAASTCGLPSIAASTNSRSAVGPRMAANWRG